MARSMLSVERLTLQPPASTLLAPRAGEERPFVNLEVAFAARAASADCTVGMLRSTRQPSAPQQAICQAAKTQTQALGSELASCSTFFNTQIQQKEQLEYVF